MSQSSYSIPASGGGIGFVGLLTIVFIVLKLVGAIGWSWWWVLSPLWISFGVGLAVFALVLAIGIIAAVLR
ncbi:MAG: hypothetical protein WC869_08340 [Phycisphaerae bacterium]|jgi:hypothetical protein